MKHQSLIAGLIAIIIHGLVLFPYTNFQGVDFKAKRKDLVEIELLAKKKEPPPKKKIQMKKPKPKPKKVIEPPKEEEEEEIAAEEMAENKNPIYPKVAIRNQWEGTVHIKLLIKVDGSVGSILIVKSSGYIVLDKSALRAIRSWQFVPATKKGKPVASWQVIPVKFELK